jgi:hypothetical protein
MFSTLRTRFGIPGVISVIALVFAMFGGAYAASNSSDGGKATASAAKGKPGPRGKTGKTGPAGPQGPAGPAGPAGAKGDAGPAGSNGTAGASGTSVKNESEPKGVNCKEGGTKLVGSSTTYACNGEKGKEGAEGSPWTLGGALPSEATETGVWRFVGNGQIEQYLPISFPIPLSEEAASNMAVHYWTESNAPSECPGTPNEPQAEPGSLCVYIAKGLSGFENGTNVEAAKPVTYFRPDFTTEGSGVGTSGVFLYYESTPTSSHVSGSFAVTAP